MRPPSVHAHRLLVERGAHEADGPNGHTLRVAHLVEQLHVIGVVVVAKVDDAVVGHLGGALAQPLDGQIALRRAAMHRHRLARYLLVLLNVLVHVEMHVLDAGLAQEARHLLAARRAVLDHHPDALGHRHERVLQARHVGELRETLVRGRDHVNGRHVSERGVVGVHRVAQSVHALVVLEARRVQARAVLAYDRVDVGQFALPCNKILRLENDGIITTGREPLL